MITDTCQEFLTAEVEDFEAAWHGEMGNLEVNVKPKPMDRL